MARHARIAPVEEAHRQRDEPRAAAGTAAVERICRKGRTLEDRSRTFLRKDAPGELDAEMGADRNTGKVVAHGEVDAVMLANVRHEVERAGAVAGPAEVDLAGSQVGQDA